VKGHPKRKNQRVQLTCDPCQLFQLHVGGPVATSSSHLLCLLVVARPAHRPPSRTVIQLPTATAPHPHPKAYMTKDDIGTPRPPPQTLTQHRATTVTACSKPPVDEVAAVRCRLTLPLASATTSLLRRHLPFVAAMLGSMTESEFSTAAAAPI
jgi:hypothetical protein